MRLTWVIFQGLFTFFWGAAKVLLKLANLSGVLTGVALLKIFRLTVISFASESDPVKDLPASTDFDWHSSLACLGGVCFMVGLSLSVGVGYYRLSTRKTDATTTATTVSDNSVVEVPAATPPQNPQAWLDTYKSFNNSAHFLKQTLTDHGAGANFKPFIRYENLHWLGQRPFSIFSLPVRLWYLSGSNSDLIIKFIVAAGGVLGAGFLMWRLAETVGEARPFFCKPQVDPTALPEDWEEKMSPTVPKLTGWASLVQLEQLELTYADFQGLTRNLLDPNQQLSEPQLADLVTKLVLSFRQWPQLQHGVPVYTDMLDSWGPQRPAVLRVLLRVSIGAAIPFPAHFHQGFSGDAKKLPVPLALMPNILGHLDGSASQELRRIYRHNFQNQESLPPNYINDRLKLSGYWYVSRALHAQGTNNLFNCIPLTLLQSSFLGALFKHWVTESAKSARSDYLALCHEQQQPLFSTSLATQVYYHCIAEQAAAQTFRALEWAAFGADPPTLRLWLLTRQPLQGAEALNQWATLLDDPAKALGGDHLLFLNPTLLTQ